MNCVETIENKRQITKCEWSPWHGETLTGWPVRTWVGGKEVYRAGDGGRHLPWISEEPLGSEALYDHTRGGYWGTQP